MGWRYGACRRTYKTINQDGEEISETLLELVEVFPPLPDNTPEENEGNYTAEAVSISVDGEDSKEVLANWLRQAARDVEENDIIIDTNVVVTDLRVKNNA